MTRTITGSRALFRMAWRVDRRKTLVSVALMAGAAVAGPLLALCLGLMTDAIVAGWPAGAAGYGVAVAFLAVVSLSFRNFAYVSYVELAELAEQAFVEDVMTLSNGSAGIEHHERPDYADMITLLDPDSRRFPSTLQALFNSAGLFLAVIGTAVLLARLHPLLLLLPIAAVPPLLAGRRAQRMDEAARKRTAEPVRIARNLFRISADARHAGEIRVSGLGGEIRRRHGALWSATSRSLWRASTRSSLVRAAGQLVFGCAYIGAVILVVRETIVGRGAVGDVVVAVALAGQVNQQVASVMTLLTSLQRNAAMLGRLEAVRELVADRTPATRVPPGRLDRGIELRDVGFAYSGEAGAEALRGVSVTLPAGATIGVVGENGAGKSTLVKLLCGLYRPTSGQILVDGEDLARTSVDAWRLRVAAGFQDFVRYEFSARTAVGLGDLPRVDDDAAVREALERAHASDIVEQLPAGLDSQLGTAYTSGADLSGGQWQKLALGRALMREEPLLLVLDEPTSALDPEAEHHLFRRYAERAREVTRRTGGITLLVSHRFSTVHMAELILVMEDGRITEFGDHDALMQRNGLYAELYEIQAAAYR